MKIQEPVRVNVSDPQLTPSDRSTTSNTSFQKIIGSYSKELTQDRLQQLLQNIEQQGQTLSEKRTFHELRKYKDLVKQYMNEVSKHGVKLHQSETWDPYAGSKTLKTIKTIDTKLMELTKHVLDEQTTSLSILERIGEIKGLLINLYT
ncbi:YaaR family protein [Bacillus marasmi]|uniref:YaaR family protein n=1 Tax=Bacillus marasmi TaxID=1926279 RepID=UPI0011C7829E|nr:YaaR family protein [Bacillus marasmi]